MKIGQLITWLEIHDKLAGWAQFSGAILALALTYFTAFAPTWRRKRQLRAAAKRLLLNGYEAVESYHRTSAHFAPFALSVRQASLTMASVAEEMARFPIYELDGQGKLSLARRLVSMNLLVSTVRLFLDEVAKDLELRTEDGGNHDPRTATPEEHEVLRAFLADKVDFAGKLVLGLPMQRPDWALDASPTKP